MEAEAPIVPYGAQSLSLVRGHDSLGRVLYHCQVMPLCDLHDGIHLAGHARIVHGHNGFRPLCHRSLYELLVHIHGIRPDIHEHGHSPPQHKGVRRGHKGIGRHDDLVPGADLIHQKGSQLRGMGAGGGQQAFRGAGLFLDPFIAFFRIRPVAADLLVLHTFPDIAHGIFGIGRYIKVYHILCLSSFLFLRMSPMVLLMIYLGRPFTSS